MKCEWMKTIYTYRGTGKSVVRKCEFDNEMCKGAEECKHLKAMQEKKKGQP